ncbi:TonB-dependent siderophore receptor [Ideonella sp. 4Y16]|uniref:TonB-dependent siderophore receptor n=1 Tax=Ideonella alba TaxID=2824118 RepID=A0A941BJU0_9BURK|nr:TonB-dependent siderophore receptor [Ideonella alba]MBQ0929449.1 TonB-dependent siderophore receptor [Ideonella alba]MBQ0944551.1 TonB-dependent siderophore receptor [Ideonella alba]
MHDLTRHTLLPLGALAAGFGVASLAVAQTAPPDAAASETVLPVVKLKAAAEPTAKDSVQATTTSIGKGTQALRDLGQSITVVTEKLIDDRHLDTMKDVLRNTAGITFLAAEGGEEDIRLRGFPLQSTGDVFVDGLRDPAFYDRDTFFLDRVEVLRGSASMLFGRGSTGGAVNQVTKTPRLIDEHQVDLTVGSHGYVRGVGDFNLKMGDNAALRLGTMVTQADSNGAGSAINKTGVAAAYRWGIGERDEFLVSASVLDNRNGMNYGLPWIRPSASATVDRTTLLPLDPDSYYGLASDYNASAATQVTLSHTHRFAPQVQWRTQLRSGHFTRDQRAGTVRLCGPRAVTAPDGSVSYTPNAACPDQLVPVTLENFSASTALTRGTNLKIQNVDTLALQSDLSAAFEALGLRHELTAGFDAAQERKRVYAARSAAQGGVTIDKPVTTVGTPDDGASVDESSRVLRLASAYTSQALGVYAQDLLQLAPSWKLLAGLRYDHLQGDYTLNTLPANAAGPLTTTAYQMTVSEWSQRLGLLFQPNDRMSFHLSGATSFNTSGDAYSLSAANADVPPEQSINLELGARLESADGQWSLRTAAFRSTKLHERNTDPDSQLVTLSGRRHVAGLEIDVAGRLTPQWEVFASYMWMPVAKIDEGVAGSEGEGTRPSLTPRHSGTVWTTYQLTPRWRVGGGLNARSSQSPNRNPGWTAPGYITADLMAEVVVVPERFTVKAHLTNVTNKLYAESLYSGHYIPGAGRLLMLTGSLKF